MRIASIVAVTWLLVGCGTPRPSPESPPASNASDELDGAPRWVRGCADFRKRALLCGVGVAAGIENPALARSAAVGRGRAQIAQDVLTSVRTTLQDLQSMDRQAIEETSKQLSEETLYGSTLEDTWVSPNGTVYALVVAPGETLERAVRDNANLDPGARAALRVQSLADLEEEFEEGAPR